jgi:nicotinate-nucleotide pyrophosphorylase (carboxylating)
VTMLAALPDIIVEPIVRAALLEDLGRAGDITTDTVVPADARMRAVIASRQSGVIAGIDGARLAFRLIDPEVRFTVIAGDGTAVVPGGVVVALEGSARSILTAERVALNLMCRLSGIASATARLVALAAGTNARIAATRKTTPGLRALEKHAVRAGGGTPHRYGLDDAVLIKDNHIAVAGGITSAVARARAGVGHLVKVEVEADTLEQVAEAAAAGADVILLDNMAPEQLRAAVALVAGRCVLEASGGVSEATLAAIAATGVDLISSGWLTHSAPALDLGLDVA